MNNQHQTNRAGLFFAKAKERLVDVGHQIATQNSIPTASVYALLDQAAKSQQPVSSGMYSVDLASLTMKKHGWKLLNVSIWRMQQNKPTLAKCLKGRKSGMI